MRRCEKMSDSDDIERLEKKVNEIGKINEEQKATKKRIAEAEAELNDLLISKSKKKIRGLKRRDSVKTADGRTVTEKVTDAHGNPINR
jgi:ribosomal protein L35